MKIELGSFIATGSNKYGQEVGTVEVDGKTRKAARDPKYGTVQVHGYIGRYRTSPKPWQARVSALSDGRINVFFGRDDRSGRFNKQNMISYDPNLFDTLSNAEYWNAQA